MIKGQSFTIGIIFDAGYDKERIQSLELNIGEKIVGKLSDNTISLEDDIYICRLTSQQTSFLPSGNIPVTVHLQDSILGVRKSLAGTLEISSSKSKTTSEKKNELVDYFIELTIDGEQITTNATLQTMYQGAQGTTPHIGENGNWWVGETDTGVKAEGEPGQQGIPGNPRGQYDLVIPKKDAVWVDDWLKISHNTSVSNKEIVVYKMSIQLGDGIKSLGAIVAYPRAETYNGSVPEAFYLKDVDAILSRTTNFDHVQIEYSILNIPVGMPPKYDTRNEIGENVIQDENDTQIYHSREMRKVFMACYPDLWAERGIQSFESIKEPLMGNRAVSAAHEPKAFENFKANLLLRPYGDGALTEQSGSSPSRLKVAAHGANWGQFIYLPGGQQEYNITPADNVHLTNVVAVAARVDDMETTEFQTTFGRGVEFFEDITALDVEFPAKTYLRDRAIGTIDETGFIYSAPTYPDWVSKSKFQVGEKVYINVGSNDHDNPEVVENAVVEEIINDYTVRFASPLTPGTGKIAYIYGDLTMLGGQQQSPTCSIVGAKLKKIKLLSGANWQIVREAARMTAKKTHEGLGFVNVPGHWDKYRGFGKIQPDAAIQWIKDNYTENQSYIDSIVADVQRAHGINKLLKYEDITENTPVTKKMLEERLQEFLEQLNI